MHKDLLKIKNGLFVLLSLFLFLISSVSYSLPFTILPTAGTQLPTTVNQGSTVAAFYTVTNKTGSQRNNNFVKYLPLNVSQVTTGAGVCGATFNLAPSGQAGSSCILRLIVSGPVSSMDPDRSHHLFVCFPGGITCAGTPNPLNVRQTQVAEKVLTSLAVIPVSANINATETQQYSVTGTYSDGTTANLTSQVTWRSSTAAASISASGLATGVSAGTTLITAVLGSVVSNSAILNVANPLISIAITPSAATLLRIGRTQQFTATGTYFDQSTQDITTTVSWNSSTPATATISSTGVLTGVAVGTTNITATLDGITSNSQTTTVSTFAYIANSNTTTVSYCPVNSSDGTLGTCTSVPVGITAFSVAVDSTARFLYVTPSASGVVQYCEINSDGSISNCINAGGSSLTSSANGMAIDSTNQFIYIAVINGITSCALNPNGSLGACNFFSNGLGVTSSEISLDSLGTTLFMTNVTSTRALAATVNPATGALSAFHFTPTSGGGNITGYGGLALNPATPNTYAYLAAEAAATPVLRCLISGSNFVNPCAAPGGVSIGAFDLLGATINAAGTFAYFTSYSTNIVRYCSINNVGNFLACDSTGGGLNGPTSIEIS